MIEVSRVPPALVWRAAEGVYGWVERGLGFVLHTAVGRWQPLTDAALCAGRVATPAERVELVARFGRPLP